MNIKQPPFLTSNDYPTWARARKVVDTVDGCARSVRERGRDDGHGAISETDHTEGLGRGLAYEIHDYKGSLRYDPASRDTLSFDWKHVHDEGFHNEHRATLRALGDGSKLYTVRNSHDWTSLVSDKTETVKLAADGTMTYAETDNSPKFENFLRQNRALERVGMAALGGAVAGGLGALAGGPVFGAMTGSIGAMVGNAVARESQTYHTDAPYSKTDLRLLRYADKFNLTVNLAGAASIATLALMVAAATT